MCFCTVGARRDTNQQIAHAKKTNMSAQHFLRCLGQPVLFSPSGEAIRIRTKKHLALLVYLAIESRRSHRRDDLAEFLWPKAKISEARHSLSTALSLFRSRLGRDALECSRERIALKQGRLALDLDRLLAGDIAGDESTAPLEVTAFLDGFDIPDAAEFTLWKDGQQARLLPAIKQTLVALMDRCHRVGNFHQIEALADRMLALDDLSEEAIRAKMEARALSGDRITALRVFEEWRTKLAAELGAVPSELLEGMAMRLRQRGWERVADRPNPSALTDQRQHRPFVNRRNEYQVLYEAWKRTKQGLPGHLLILGDSGIGKTTLVQRFTTAVEFEGAAITRVQCYDLEQEIPYAAISALISGLLEQPGASATPPEALAELSRTVPDVRRRFPLIPPSVNSHGETARIRLTEAAIDLLLSIAEEHLVLLVIDDLHFADDASLAVLHLIMRRTRGQPVMVFFITRPGELPQSPHAVRLRESTATLGIQELNIHPLTDEDSQTLLLQLDPINQLQSGAFTRCAILRAAAGYPMVLELLVQDWHTNRERCLAISLNAMTEDLTSSETIIATYDQIIKRITWTLSPATTNGLNLAAILGQRLNDLNMYTLIGLEAHEIISGMTELISRCVLRDTNQKLEFANELIRNAAYINIPSPVRKKLHSQIADRLIQQEQKDNTELGLEIAWHCTRAGRRGEATPHLLHGADEALSRGAIHSAEYALTTAYPDLIGADRARAAMLLAEVLQEQGKWAESLQWLQEYANTPSDLYTTFTLQATHNLDKYTTEHITTSVRALMNIIRESPISSTQIKAARAATALLSDLRNPAVPIELLQCIDAVQDDQLPPQDLIPIIIARAMCLYYMNEKETTVAILEDAVRRMEFSGIVNSNLSSLFSGLGAIRCQEGNYTEALSCLLQAHDVATRIGNDPRRSNTAINVALCYGRLGEYQKQLEWADKASAASRRAFYGDDEIRIVYYAAMASAMLGNTESAKKLILDAEQFISDSLPDWQLQVWHLYKADILYMIGEHVAAVTVAKTGLRHPDLVLHCDAFAGLFSRWLALTTESPDDRRQAQVRISELRARAVQLDAIDRVEILCAEFHIRSKNLIENEKIEHQEYIRRELQKLPRAVTYQLEALGMFYP